MSPVTVTFDAHTTTHPCMPKGDDPTMNASTTPAMPVATATPDARAEFIRRTYMHVAVAILLFAIVEWLLLQWSGAQNLANRMTSGYTWLAVLLAFMFVSSLADRWARSPGSTGKQYAGFGVFILAEAVLFLPMLLAVSNQADDVLASAALITLLMVIGLTAVVVLTRTDFSFLRSALTIGGFIALGLIVASIIFGFGLGLIFSVAMVAFASGSVLYNTSNIMRTYRTDQPVAAALALFASIALLFWYVVRIVSSQRR